MKVCLVEKLNLGHHCVVHSSQGGRMLCSEMYYMNVFMHLIFNGKLLCIDRAPFSNIISAVTFVLICYSRVCNCQNLISYKFI